MLNPKWNYRLPTRFFLTDIRLAAWSRLRARAVRLAGEDEADDLLQDTFLAAVRVGREPLVSESDLHWAFGTMRNLGKMHARERSRRQRREQAVADETVGADTSQDLPACSELNLARRWLDEFPSAQRQIIHLLLAGLNRAEIRQTLNVTDMALRQRLTALRASLRALPAPLASGVMAAALRRPSDPNLELGLMRRALKAELLRAGGIGIHDPDGHLMVIRESGPHK